VALCVVEDEKKVESAKRSFCATPVATPVAGIWKDDLRNVNDCF